MTNLDTCNGVDGNAAVARMTREEQAYDLERRITSLELEVSKLKKKLEEQND